MSHATANLATVTSSLAVCRLENKKTRQTYSTLKAIDRATAPTAVYWLKQNNEFSARQPLKKSNSGESDHSAGEVRLFPSRATQHTDKARQALAA